MVRPRNVNKGRKSLSAPAWEQAEIFASRTQIKQAAQAVNDLGEQLAQMKAGDLARFNLTDEVKEAIALLQRLKKGPAYKRQKAYLGKLLRSDEPLLTHIRETMAHMVLEGRQAQAVHKQVEQWRDRLIATGDEALADLLAQFPNADRQYLRSLIRQAQDRDKQPQKAEKAHKALFQALKALYQETNSL